MASQGDSNPGGGPGDAWAAITPHDTNALPFRPVAIHNGSATGGTVVVKDGDGVTTTFYLAAGATLRIRPNIITTASTVSNIVGLKR